MHECPDCGQLCTCRGDIDDIDFGIDIECECPCSEEDEWVSTESEAGDGR